MKAQTKCIGLVMLLSLLILGGCGQKGPLYLPSEEADKNSQQK
ncbi:LPS translocon maturation chaperone LptM [Neptuniibacter marinus]|nr:lipoprotein [Neptuniibacter marinus]